MDSEKNQETKVRDQMSLQDIKVKDEELKEWLK